MARKTGLITGASSGIGGDLLVVLRRHIMLEKRQAELETNHQVTILVIESDLTNSETLTRVFQQVQKPVCQSIGDKAMFRGKLIVIDDW